METVGIDISKFIIEYSEYIESLVEYGFLYLVAGNVLSNKYSRKLTETVPLSDIITDYFKKGNKK